MKKIIFPFFNKEHHDFLIGKWWFRLFIIFYVVGVYILFSAISNWNGWDRNLLWALPGTLVLTAIIHYIIQFIFFKIIIDFIVLGNKK